METGNHGGPEEASIYNTFIESRSWQMTNTWFDETTMKKLLYIVPWSWLETVWANLAVILDPPRREQTEGVPRKKRAILRNSKLFLEESHVSRMCYANVLRHVRSKNGGGRGRNESLVIKKLKLFRSNSFCLSFTLLFVFPSFFFWLVFVLLEKHKTRRRGVVVKRWRNPMFYGQYFFNI